MGGDLQDDWEILEATTIIHNALNKYIKSYFSVGLRIEQHYLPQKH
jgi:hypothetical protein